MEGRSLEFKASLVYVENSKTARAAQRNSQKNFKDGNLGLVVHTYNPRTWEFEASFVHIENSRPGLHSETCLKRKSMKPGSDGAHL